MDCPSCGTPNAPGTNFCESCGTPIQGPRRRRKKSTRAPSDPLDRRRANRELGSAFKTIKAIRSIFVFYAVVSALWIVLAILASDYLEPGILGLLVAVLSVQCVVSVLGAIQVQKHPFPWSVALASVMTLTAVMTGPSLAIDWIVHVFFTVSAWASLTVTLPVQRLIKENPDLRIAQKLAGKHERAEESATGASVRGRVRRKRADTMRTTLVYSGVVVIGLIGVVYGVSKATEKLTLPETVKDFIATWKDGDIDDISDYALDDQQGQVGRDIRLALMAGRSTLPEIASWEQVSEQHGSISLMFRIAGGRVVYSDWAPRRGGWRIARLVVVPPVEETIKKYVGAWNASDFAALGNFGSEGRQYRLQRSIKRIDEKRGWDGKLPEVSDWRVTVAKDLRADVGYDTSGGKMQTTFVFEVDRWVLKRFDPPDR